MLVGYGPLFRGERLYRGNVVPLAEPGQARGVGSSWGALWILGALAFVLWLALFSYDAGDPGFTQASGTGDISRIARCRL